MVMHQRWDNLLFLHWACDPQDIQPMLPEGLRVDTFDGKAWIAIVPFDMCGIRPRFCPPVPGVSDFLELNVRTYAYDEQGRAGVWFASLDCNQGLAVWTARTFFHLPYQDAQMSRTVGPDGHISYRSQRRGDTHVSDFSYRRSPETRTAQPGTLDFFLAERYLLFSKTPGGLRTGRVHHAPYPLAEVELERWDDRVFRLDGWPAQTRPPDHVIASPGVQVKVFPLQG
jgi:hypothetical protein